MSELLDNFSAWLGSLPVLLVVVIFAIGILGVVKGGDWFVDAAASIAKDCHIPTFIIGATIVSIATTLPEMIVSVMAAADGSNDMAVGNAVGSVTANTAMILAVGMIFMNIVCSRKKYLLQILLLIGACVTLVVSSLGGSLHFIGSIVLAVIFVVFMIQNIRSAKSESRELTAAEPLDKKKLRMNILWFVIGALTIVIGSRLMVDGGCVIAERLGVPERIIAVTLVAVGTSLPELVTTITAIIKKESALSIGNIIGANIIDLTLILPVCSIVSGQQLPVAAESIAIDFPACLIVTLVGMLPVIFRQKTSKIQGALLLCCYAAYLVIIL